MGVYIKGMEMPTRCMDCPFMVSRDNDDCILQSDEANANFKDWDEMKASCPLVLVPPHGRLIDADALKEEFENLVYQDNWYYNALRHAPTIIPAEEGET